MFCSNCGAEVNDNAVVCVKCGCAVGTPATVDVNASGKDWIVTLLLCFFLGQFGIHRFYAGKTGTGILQLITLGCCGIWTLIDFIIIAVGNFTDAEGKRIVNKG
ncbi:MAG: TM2 domain-containing protein [Alistipes sp.]|nr:TM2 domain-containing protein [Alistipes sp.]